MTKQNNPYVPFIGLPNNIIPRNNEINILLKEFELENPCSHLCMITGLRGIGKTTFADIVKSKLRQEPEWISIDLNSSTDLFFDFVTKLASNTALARWFYEENIKLSKLIVTTSYFQKTENIGKIIIEMLKMLKKHNSKILIVIDEVVNTTSIRKFIATYQELVLQKLPVYLIVVGLYENIQSLKTNKK